MRPDGGSFPQREALRFSPAFQERVPQLLLPRPPCGPGRRLRAGGGGDGVDRGRSRLRDLATGAADPGRSRGLDADRVLAPPSRLPLGARQRPRPPHALHHPRHPPRPPQRQDAAGDAAVGLDPAGGALPPPPLAGPLAAPPPPPPAAFWLILGDAPFPPFAGFILGYLFYDYTHYYVHHFVPRTDFGKRLREHHMRHHFQDHRYGYGVSSPLWDFVFRTQPRKRSKYRQ